MSPENFARIRAAFDAAMEAPESERAAVAKQFLADAPELQAEVLSLLELEAAQADRRTQRAFDLAIHDLAAQEQQSWIGRRIGRFEVIAEIGSGGMGRVFKARNCDDREQLVALKVVRPERFNRSLAERFSTERSILARLNHPGIAYFVDAGSIEGLSYIAMELVEGSTLIDYAAQQRLSIKQKLMLFQELLEAVGHAHRALIIHRDIKSDNVLVRSDGHVKLLDFGIAKPLSQNPTGTATQERAFTPISAAPEQILGQASTVATDVYALGMLLYELISGTLPFAATGRRSSELEHEVLTLPPPRMSHRCRALGKVQMEAIPDDLERIVAKALRKEPEGRYRSVEQLQSDLTKFLADEPISLAGNGRFYRFRKFVVRHRLAVSLSTIAILAVLTALIVSLYQNQRIRRERDLSQSALSVLKEAFAAADPSGEGGARTTARDVLDQSLAQITPLKNSNPEAYVSLAATIGETQLALGLTEPAVTLLERALTEAARDNTMAADQIRIQLARALTEQTYVSRAEALLGELGSAARRSGPALLVEGRIAVRRKQWQRAEALLREALTTLPFGSSDWLFAESQLAVALAETDRSDLAMAGIEHAQTQLLAQYPDRVGAVARLYLARIDVLDSARALDHLCREGPNWVTRIRNGVGARSAIAGIAAFRVALACQELQNNSAAADSYRLALEGLVPALGYQHPYSYRAQFNLALCLVRDDAQVPEALAALRDATAGAEADSPRQADLINTFRMYLSRELGKPKTPAALEAALLALPTMQSPITELGLPAVELKFQRDWINYLFWSIDCAKGTDRKSLTPETACQAKLLRADCADAQRSLCDLSNVPKP